ncbi:quinone oxidoreductase [Pseudokineococcus marinus]|uniref:Quinone oxidoreductase n=1 Tax=Pseudokineococcus marinus TaxID=351215 RepID=A0A849BPZ8_9ACTN|nr:quinone oxidoreductase [Pseudokineococcus marinus]NNH22624.1 quinone oxidoreductase [Pseudokineococcus marinus]
MRAAQVRRTGGPEVVEVVDVEEPRPGPGQVLVEVDAAGVNFIDTYHRSGTYPVATPFGLGLEGAGRVVAAGEGADLPEGGLVAWKQAPGSCAERVVVDAAEAVPVPDGVDAETAAALMLQGLTAQYLCASTYPVAPGDVVVVHAAAGGVGLLLTQMVVLRGGRVLATTSTPEKAELARGAGAEEVLGYEDFAARARELTDGEGVAAVYDGVGRATFAQGLDALRPRGTMVLFGGASGQVEPLDLQQLNAKGSLYVTRPSLAAYTRTREELLERAGAVLGWAAQGRLSVRVGGRYALEDVARAHEDLEGRRTTGKLLVLPEGAAEAELGRS